jgi:Tfp pilus assembly protein PilF
VNAGRTTGLALLAFAIAGACGFWSGAPVPVLLVGFLVLPGLALAASVLESADVGRGPGRFAWAAAGSLALVVPAVLPQFLRGASLTGATPVLVGVYAVVAATAVFFSRAGEYSRDAGAWKAFSIAAVLVLPAVLHYSGGTVDDWWDMAFVRAYVDGGPLSFSEPILGTGVVHPRFAWNSWLVVQSLIVGYSGVAPEALHNPWLAGAACLLGLAAVDALARVVFGEGRKTAHYAALLFVPAWAWGTEAAPYFTRFYQDKFVAGFVLAPTMLAAAVVAVRAGTLRAFAAFAIVAVATVAVHGVVYAIAAIGCVTALVGAAFGVPQAIVRSRTAFLESSFARRAGVAVAILIAAGAYPLWQALTLYSRFAGQGISLSTPDNPVVRAHLALGRLVGTPDLTYVVHPGAVFGAVAFVGGIGVAVAIARRRSGDAILLSLTFVPAILLFVPGAVAAAGVFLVPWMVYRIGWLVPICLLAGRAFEGAWSIRRLPLRALCAVALVSLTGALVVPTTVRRVERGMREHPGQSERAPRGTTLEIYEALRGLPGDSPVFAPPGFSSLVPGVSGKPVVALSERGTLVFSTNERRAYERLRDRARFFSESTDARSRQALARAYGSRYAVFRRGYVTAGSANRLFDRATAEGFLLSEAERGSPTWTADRDSLTAAIPASWRILVENPDFFLVETQEPARRKRDVVGPVGGAGEGAAPVARKLLPVWAAPFAVDAEAGGVRSHDGLEILASTAAFPGAAYSVSPVPFGVGISEKLVWSRGNAVWEDGPDAVTFEIDMQSRCDVAAVAVVPYLPEGTRRAFEIRVPEAGGTTVARRIARDLEPLVVEFDRVRTARLRIDVRSLMGLPLGIAEIHVLGDRSACEADWAPLPRPRWRQQVGDVAALLELAARYPGKQRAAIGVASLLGDHAPDDARAVLRNVLQRETAGAAAWIELGLLNDAEGDEAQAHALYRRARRADSNSAWARGCLAWSALRRGRPLASVCEAWRATRLDPRYADAFTILGMNADRLGATATADRMLARAMELDPRRSWPHLVEARRLAGVGKEPEAERIVREFLRRVPDDTDAWEYLVSLRKSDGPPQGG